MKNFNNTKDFINYCTQIYGTKYDYTKVVYKTLETKVCIICPEHGEFWQTPKNHLNGYEGCKMCCNNKLGEKTRKGRENFIKESLKVFGNKYDYSKVEYINNHTKVCIICPEHGEFWQTPKNHLKGHECIKCSHEKVRYNHKSDKQFIQESIAKHGNKYDYSKVNYINSTTKVCIICPEHGEFWQTPNAHLSGSGCKKCNNAWNTRPHLTSEYFINKFKEKFNTEYDYSKVEYINSKTKITIICPIHGKISILPHNFLNRGCPLCRKEEAYKKIKKQNFLIKKSKEELLKKDKKIKHEKYLKEKTNDIINKFKIIHGNKYDYSKVKYINSATKVCIICPEHGEFWQLPCNHLKGKGCKKCAKISASNLLKSNTEEFIQKAKQVHGKKYEYNKANYKNARNKVCIICPEHGEFWQAPYNHLLMNGCPECARGKISKEYILKRKLNEYFKEYKIVSEKRFKWLGKQRIDIFLCDYNIAIEYQGIQHFKPVDIFGGIESFKKCRELDIKKNTLLKEHGIEILYFSYDLHQGDFPYYVISNYDELVLKIEEIINNKNGK